MDLLILCAPAGSALLWGIAVGLALKDSAGSSGRRYTRTARERPYDTGAGARLQQLLLVEAASSVMDRLGIQERFQLPLAAMHGKLVVLRGRGWSLSDTERYAAFSVGAGWAVWTGGTAMAALAKEPAMLLLSGVIGLLLPVMKLREPAQLAERRRQNIVLALPDLLGKLMLLVGAGETVQRALVRCWSGQASGEERALAQEGARRKRKGPDQSLHEEWGRMVRALENGESFAAAVESFSRRCAVQEVSMFATVMLLHHRKGGDQFALALRELSYSLWEKRKATARMRGEEASSKLVFPLAAIFGLLMIAVAAPAILMMP
ncbi:type II secretion system F family protein [Paenibacillus kobensis]|uniref:type II secretion system F family protein n=1 Tax=Paenibacillus kobensis TaxID=59841 RepID=UPI000FDAB1C0|nr:type II secretion system F family protein [Paenibacillus kobensis]